MEMVKLINNQSNNIQSSNGVKRKSLSERLKNGEFKPIVIEENSIVTDQPAKRKRSTKSVDTSNIVKPSKKGKDEESKLPMYKSNVPYKTEYEETDNILNSTVAQLDRLAYDIQTDIDSIKNSKTLRNKYTYLTNLYSSFGSILSCKISAAREMNSSITKAVELDLKRAKELNLSAKDDDKSVLNAYKAFISMPYGSNNGPSYTPNNNIPVANTLALMSSRNFAQPHPTVNEDAIFQNYMNNLTPEQNLMRYEEDPNVETVVIYDKNTFEKRFAVMNTSTGEEINNVPVLDTEMFMPDTVIDEAAGIARNNKLNQTYKLVVIGGDNNFDMYY